MYLGISSKGRDEQSYISGERKWFISGRQKTSIATWSSQSQLQGRWNVFSWQNSCPTGNLQIKIWPNHNVVNIMNEKKNISNTRIQSETL